MISSIFPSSKERDGAGIAWGCYCSRLSGVRLEGWVEEGSLCNSLLQFLTYYCTLLQLKIWSFFKQISSHSYPQGCSPPRECLIHNHTQCPHSLLLTGGPLEALGGQVSI
ncbi:hypothetical protein FGO68_gene13743 [Halteria grandinella]|uniref:Uncharacterized protein n=1 Tax=Halteria grandinella TaxID=5974 RepID=A0A8J8NC28_HALGN|nr:hypothetical protein FGO68_gene13743 [Halteria grandinella]